MDLGNKNFCVRCHSMYEDMVMAGGTPKRVVAEMKETPRKVEALQEDTRSLAKRGRSRRRREIVDGTGFLLLEQSLAVWPSFPGEMCGGDGVMVEDLYSVFTFQLLRNFLLGVSKTLKAFLTPCLSWDGIYSHM